MISPVRVIVVGAGCRGEIYSKFATIHPERVQVVGVADPRKFARSKLQQQHKIVDENIFDDWHRIADREKFADAVLVCTPDHLHKEPAVAFAKKGYHILLEKPMATTAEDCRAIVEACTQSGVILSVGHVLRYDPVTRKIKELIDAGAIGDVIHIQHLEPVGFYHFAHSFVRGNWRNEAESSFVLLAKSCHDIDLIHDWAGARRCVKLSSFGSLSHFRKDKKPPGAADRCLDCSVEKDCPYSACKIYLDRVKQVVHMEFEGGLTASFSMVAFTKEMCKRKTTIYGSMGELSYNGHEVSVFDFVTQRTTKHTGQDNAPNHFGMSGHGGADYHLMDAFISAVANNDPSLIRSGPEETLLSHLLVFQAERSRLEGRVVYCDEMMQS
ncbi:uncharacterized oxidoreductase YjhC isoform X3 [Solea solea]|uniref:uncharacterized oxidoreductase YjhC isoform X3 n=1 Tax=Solea solea TaxID=90069 RepID=UPI00272AA6A2|nr:uncharacterized oxidoreductase YjhC isoform X3 [Solea solea]